MTHPRKSASNTDRNHDIYQSRKNGASIKELADRYGISRKRVYQIYEYEYTQSHRQLEVPEIALATYELGHNRNMYSRILNLLHSMRLLDSWKYLTENELWEIKGMGEASCAVIFRAQELAKRFNNDEDIARSALTELQVNGLF